MQLEFKAILRQPQQPWRSESEISSLLTPSKLNTRYGECWLEEVLLDTAAAPDQLAASLFRHRGICPGCYMFMACTQSYTRGCVDHREYIVYSEIAFAPWRDRGTHRGHLRCGTPLQTASNASATGGFDLVPLLQCQRHERLQPEQENAFFSAASCTLCKGSWRVSWRAPCVFCLCNGTEELQMPYYRRQARIMKTPAVEPES